VTHEKKIFKDFAIETYIKLGTLRAWYFFTPDTWISWS